MRRHLVNGHAAARSGEWAQHFSNASCYKNSIPTLIDSISSAVGGLALL